MNPPMASGLGLGAGVAYARMMNKGADSNQEFSIQKEEFPALGDIQTQQSATSKTAVTEFQEQQAAHNRLTDITSDMIGKSLRKQAGVKPQLAGGPPPGHLQPGPGPRNPNDGSPYDMSQAAPAGYNQPPPSHMHRDPNLARPDMNGGMPINHPAHMQPNLQTQMSNQSSLSNGRSLSPRENGMNIHNIGWVVEEQITS